MANQEEVRDVYGYFEQKGNALCYRYEAERVRIGRPWGADSFRVRAWKNSRDGSGRLGADHTGERSCTEISSS